MKKTLRIPALLTILTTPACLGPFNAFNTVSSWNSRVSESKWANEAVYIGLWIIPVYEFALIFDSLVFNAFEFWGAENPIAKPTEHQSQAKK
jgi:hypothetical protein